MEAAKIPYPPGTIRLMGKPGKEMYYIKQDPSAGDAWVYYAKPLGKQDPDKVAAIAVQKQLDAKAHVLAAAFTKHPSLLDNPDLTTLGDADYHALGATKLDLESYLKDPYVSALGKAFHLQAAADGKIQTPKVVGASPAKAPAPTAAAAPVVEPSPLPAPVPTAEPASEPEVVPPPPPPPAPPIEEPAPAVVELPTVATEPVEPEVPDTVAPVLAAPTPVPLPEPEPLPVETPAAVEPEVVEPEPLPAPAEPELPPLPPVPGPYGTNPGDVEAGIEGALKAMSPAQAADLHAHMEELIADYEADAGPDAFPYVGGAVGPALVKFGIMTPEMAAELQSSHASNFLLWDLGRAYASAHRLAQLGEPPFSLLTGKSIQDRFKILKTLGGKHAINALKDARETHPNLGLLDPEMVLGAGWHDHLLAAFDQVQDDNLKAATFQSSMEALNFLSADEIVAEEDGGLIAKDFQKLPADVLDDDQWPELNAVLQSTLKTTDKATLAHRIQMMAAGYPLKWVAAGGQRVEELPKHFMGFGNAFPPSLGAFDARLQAMRDFLPDGLTYEDAAHVIRKFTGDEALAAAVAFVAADAFEGPVTFPVTFKNVALHYKEYAKDVPFEDFWKAVNGTDKTPDSYFAPLPSIPYDVGYNGALSTLASWASKHSAAFGGGVFQTLKLFTPKYKELGESGPALVIAAHLRKVLTVGLQNTSTWDIAKAALEGTSAELAAVFTEHFPKTVDYLQSLYGDGWTDQIIACMKFGDDYAAVHAPPPVVVEPPPAEAPPLAPEAPLVAPAVGTIAEPVPPAVPPPADPQTPPPPAVDTPAPTVLEPPNAKDLPDYPVGPGGLQAANFNAKFQAWLSKNTKAVKSLGKGWATALLVQHHGPYLKAKYGPDFDAIITANVVLPSVILKKVPNGEAAFVQAMKSLKGVYGGTSPDEQARNLLVVNFKRLVAQYGDPDTAASKLWAALPAGGNGVGLTPPTTPLAAPPPEPEGKLTQPPIIPPVFPTPGPAVETPPVPPVVEPPVVSPLAASPPPVPTAPDFDPSAAPGPYGPIDLAKHPALSLAYIVTAKDPKKAFDQVNAFLVAKGNIPLDIKMLQGPAPTDLLSNAKNLPLYKAGWALSVTGSFPPGASALTKLFGSEAAAKTAAQTYFAAVNKWTAGGVFPEPQDPASVLPEPEVVATVDAEAIPSPVNEPSPSPLDAPAPAEAVSNVIPPMSELKLVPGAGAKLAGIASKEIFEDAAGNRYIFRYAQAPGTTSVEPFRNKAQVIAAKLQAAAQPYAPGLREDTYNGVPGTIQPFVKVQARATLADYAEAPEKLSPANQIDVMVAHAIDWVSSNHDNHAENHIRVKINGVTRVLGIDKTQCYRFWNSAQAKTLSTNYKPNEKVPYSNIFWSAFGAGKFNLSAEAFEALGAGLDKMASIPDAEFLADLKAYQDALPPGSPNKGQEFLDAANARRKNAKADFEKFIGGLFTKRTGKAGTFTFDSGWSPNATPAAVPVTTPVAPAPSAPPPATPKASPAAPPVAAPPPSPAVLPAAPLPVAAPLTPVEKQAAPPPKAFAAILGYNPHPGPGESSVEQALKTWAAVPGVSSYEVMASLGYHGYNHASWGAKKGGTTGAGQNLQDLLATPGTPLEKKHGPLCYHTLTAFQIAAAQNSYSKHLKLKTEGSFDAMMTKLQASTHVTAWSVGGPADQEFVATLGVAMTLAAEYRKNDAQFFVQTPENLKGFATLAGFDKMTPKGAVLSAEAALASPKGVKATQLMAAAGPQATEWKSILGAYLASQDIDLTKTGVGTDSWKTKQAAKLVKLGFAQADADRAVKMAYLSAILGRVADQEKVVLATRSSVDPLGSYAGAKLTKDIAGLALTSDATGAIFNPPQLAAFIQGVQADLLKLDGVGPNGEPVGPQGKALLQKTVGKDWPLLWGVKEVLATGKPPSGTAEAAAFTKVFGQYGPTAALTLAKLQAAANANNSTEVTALQKALDDLHVFTDPDNSVPGAPGIDPMALVYDSKGTEGGKTAKDYYVAPGGQKFIVNPGADKVETQKKAAANKLVAALGLGTLPVGYGLVTRPDGTVVAARYQPAPPAGAQKIDLAYNAGLPAKNIGDAFVATNLAHALASDVDLYATTDGKLVASFKTDVLAPILQSAATAGADVVEPAKDQRALFAAQFTVNPGIGANYQTIADMEAQLEAAVEKLEGLDLQTITDLAGLSGIAPSAYTYGFAGKVNLTVKARLATAKTEAERLMAKQYVDAMMLDATDTFTFGNRPKLDKAAAALGALPASLTSQVLLDLGLQKSGAVPVQRLAAKFASGSVSQDMVAKAIAKSIDPMPTTTGVGAGSEFAKLAAPFKNAEGEYPKNLSRILAAKMLGLNEPKPFFPAKKGAGGLAAKLTPIGGMRDYDNVPAISPTLAPKAHFEAMLKHPAVVREGILGLLAGPQRAAHMASSVGPEWAKKFVVGHAATTLARRKVTDIADPGGRLASAVSNLPSSILAHYRMTNNLKGGEIPLDVRVALAREVLAAAGAPVDPTVQVGGTVTTQVKQTFKETLEGGAKPLPHLYKIVPGNTPGTYAVKLNATVGTADEAKKHLEAQGLKVQSVVAKTVGSSGWVVVVDAKEMDASKVVGVTTTAASLTQMPDDPEDIAAVAAKWKPEAVQPNMSLIPELESLPMGESGFAFYGDAEALEGQAMRVRRLEKKDGTTHYRVTAKLRPEVWAELMKNKASAAVVDYSLKEGTYDPAKDAMVETGGNVTVGDIGTTLSKGLRWKSGEATITFAHDDVPSNAKPGTTDHTGSNGYIEMDIPSGVDPEAAMRELLSAAGGEGFAERILRDPTPEERETLWRRRLLQTVAPKVGILLRSLKDEDISLEDLRALTAGDVKAAEKLFKPLRVKTTIPVNYGINTVVGTHAVDAALEQLKAADLSPATRDAYDEATAHAEAGTGYHADVLPGRWKNLAGKGKPVEGFIQGFSTGAPDALHTILKSVFGTVEDSAGNSAGGGVRGCLERAQQGVDVSGVSVAADVNSGSGDSTIGRVAKPGMFSTVQSSGYADASGILVRPEVFDRLDAYVNNGDHYGVSVGGKHGSSDAWDDHVPMTASGLQGLGSYNEVDFRRGIDHREILAVSVASASLRDSVVKKLHADGIYVLNGVPVESFIQVQLSMAKAKKELWPAFGVEV